MIWTGGSVVPSLLGASAFGASVLGASAPPAGGAAGIGAAAGGVAGAGAAAGGVAGAGAAGLVSGACWANAGVATAMHTIAMVVRNVISVSPPKAQSGVSRVAIATAFCAADSQKVDFASYPRMPAFAAHFKRFT